MSVLDNEGHDPTGLGNARYSITSSAIDVFDFPPNPWARISSIAAKVGVLPLDTGHPATIVVTGADGKPYDVWEVIEAVLDRIEQSANPSSR